MFFFLKQVICALMIVVNLLYFSNIHRFVYLRFQRIRLRRINAFKEGKLMNDLYFIFTLFRSL